MKDSKWWLSYGGSRRKEMGEEGAHGFVQVLILRWWFGVFIIVA